MWDCIIIGAGACGCAIARELSRFDADILLLDAKNQPANGPSGREIAVVHAAYADPPSSYRSIFARMGNVLFDRLRFELNIPFIRNGSLMVALNETEEEILHALQLQGEGAGVENLDIFSAEKLLRYEPLLSKNVRGGLYAPTAGVTNARALTQALFENARQNGMEFEGNARIVDIQQRHAGYAIYSENKAYAARVIINAAGIFADEITALALKKTLFTLSPRKAEALMMKPYVLPFSSLAHVRHIFPAAAPSADGRAMMIGPLFRPAASKWDDGVEPGMLARLLGAARRILPDTLEEDVQEKRCFILPDGAQDFRIGAVEGIGGFFQAAGIGMPGITAAPAIGKYLANLAGEYLGLAERRNFIPMLKMP